MTTPAPNSTNLTDLLLQNLANLPAPPPHLDPTNPDLTPAKPTLLTLHALYPTTLLPALDLLDRGLITRLDLLPPSPPPSPQQPPPPSPAVRSIYHVRSAAPPSSSSSSSGRKSRRRGEALPHSSSSSYEVRTTAWSCTCGAFAFAAFYQPQSHGGSGDGDGDDPFVREGGEREGGGMMMDDDDDEDADGYNNDGGDDGGWVKGNEGRRDDDDDDGDDDGCAERVDGKGWGGLMRGYEALEHRAEERGMGRVSERQIPVCKHLLACVVAEWWDVAGHMVEVRRVESGEMAGWAGGWVG